MKKIILTLLSVCLLLSVAVVCGCDGGNATDSKLTYGKKYIRGIYVNDEENAEYLIFNKDGTGTYEDSYYGYILKFDYTFFSDSVVCTYNSEIKAYNDGQHCDTNWYNVYKFSEDFIIVNQQYGDIVYFCENYIEKHPNFGK